MKHILVRPYRLTVRTQDFQSCNRSSILRGVIRFHQLFPKKPIWLQRNDAAATKTKFYYCYIPYSESLKMTYVGYTSNLDRRMLEHKENPTRTTQRAYEEISSSFAIYLICEQIPQNLYKYGDCTALS